MNIDNLDIDEVIASARESLFGMGTDGFCLECGGVRDGCEPDAEKYECWDCGELAVYGAETLLIVVA